MAIHTTPDDRDHFIAELRSWEEAQHKVNNCEFPFVSRSP
jgi:hypothetical protein